MQFTKRNPNGQQANERVLYFLSHKESDNETTILIKSLLHTYGNGQNRKDNIRLVKVCSNYNFSTLLVGKGLRTTALEDYFAVPTVLCILVSPLLENIHDTYIYIYSLKVVYQNIHSSTIHNSLKAEITQINLNSKMHNCVVFMHWNTIVTISKL